MASSTLIVGAIDFGTTFSGWAFSFSTDYQSDPTKVSVKQWHSGSGTLVTEKTPTVVLIKPDGKTLEAFGYDAENKFKELVENEEQEGYYYFRRFKMMLNKKMNETFNRHITLEDEFGKSVPAMTVFSNAIKFLTDDMVKEAKKKLFGGIMKSDVKWVLTVPAIWTDGAKQFMREAAVEAGIDTERIVIALEPEAASIYCRHMPVDRTVGEDNVSISSFPLETKYMILDAGGGTIDITVHEIQRDGGLKEVHAASGGGWGGILVDKAFKELLIELVGKEVYDQFVRDETDDWIDIWRTFEVKKKTIGPENNAKVVLKLPLSLLQLYKKITNTSLEEGIASSQYFEEISFTGDKIKFNASMMHDIFNPSIHQTVSHVNMLMEHQNVRDVKAILMVGGFSDSPMLQHAIKSAHSNIEVIIPTDAVSSILKGAVIFGHRPKSITERVLKYTYGLEAFLPFNEDIHPASKKVENDVGTQCKDIFHKHVEIYQSVRVGESLHKERYTPVNKAQTTIPFPIFASELRNPTFTDQGCTQIGMLTIDLPDHDEDLKRKVFVSFTFGGTEIEVTGEDDKTGTKTNVTIDYLG